MDQLSQTHNRQDSIESNATIQSIQPAGSVSSTLSTGSVSLGVYEDLIPHIQRLKGELTGKDLKAYVGKANFLVQTLAASDLNETKFCGSVLKLDGVLKGMLEHAVGVKGKQYALATIISCEADADGQTEDEKGLDKTKRLKAVAETWAFYLLFIFKAGPNGYKNQPFVTPSAATTPTLDETASFLQKGLKESRTMPRDNVLRRDGCQCVITGWVDRENMYDRETASAKVEVAHILRRAVATFKDGSKEARAAATTFDILRNFTGLGEEVIKNLEDYADHVANGITMNLLAHADWDDYLFCLKPTGVDHEYVIHYFSDGTKKTIRAMRGNVQIAPDEPVRFRDRSDEFQQKKRKKFNDEDGAQPSTSTRSGSGPQDSAKYELPSKTFIAIHAAIAGVMHMSGAGKFFDELLSKFDKNDKKLPPASCWDELVVKAVNSDLSQSVHQLLITSA
ncbi:hypothetical protein NLJ89_g1988 [Agrocybe chaxingu]|uniref:HNH nuclease domain-containing protein n=1 Tax=Agrocybe chaxingu TaxID=84603 RepID=A0A9W8TDD5_9AGAR|nr:hypothetical protein NLJ89_g1988 [Agrocybe chaxingu]